MKLEERSLENLENLYNTNLERLQSVQLELGNKRLFYPDGSEMDIAAFSYARRKL